MQSIDFTEKKLLAEIFELGYRQAAISFSSLTGQNVSIVNTCLEVCQDHDYLTKNFDHLEGLTILQTDIIGQFGGSSYLILSEEEKATIARMGLTSFDSSAKIGESAILKEIDNIISATVITQLSNALNVSIYGDVPQLFELNDMVEFHNIMNEGSEGYYLLVTSNFIFEGHGSISPIFIWKIDRKIAKD